MTDMERRDGHDIAVEAGGLIFAAYLAAPAGPLAPFIAAAATPFTRRMAERIAAEWSRKSNMIADSALQASMLDTPEHLAEALTGDPSMIALTQKILFAASVTGNDHKLRAFGDLLGGAVRCHRDRPDEINLLIDALADLEDLHVMIMDVISAPPPDERPGWLASQVQAEVKTEPDLVLACLNTLTRHGLADTNNDTYGSVEQFYLTKLGRALAEVIRHVAGEAGRSDEKQ
jgi:hypothetical protein